MKIAYLVNTYPRASHTFIRREIAALERLGHSVLRLSMRSDRAALKDAADLAEDRRTEHVLEMGGRRLVASALGWMVARPGQALAALRLALACGARGAAGVPGTGGRLRHVIYWLEAAHVARRCKDQGISHLHAHFGTNSATVALLARQMGGPEYSFTTHGPEEFDAPHALALGDKIAGAKAVVAISSYGRSQLCRWTPPDNWGKIAVVHCGIEPGAFATPSPLPEGGPHLVAIGRLAGQKGFGLLIEAMALAAPTLPDLHLTLVGDGELRGQIEGAIARAGLGTRIHLAGWQDEAGVKQALAKATALILPSFAEGLPVVVMEAMAAGRPVIATSIAGVPELVTPEVGWLVPAGDAATLADAIAKLAATPRDTLQAMGLAARKRVFARHDIDQEARKLAALFGDTP
ncbi:glycosyltransferase family 4 protein [Fuscibacter oryzae]|uniref:Glycosyltransferase family 4 protein n=1 Tax=Fuscibacter oryzae TaxID=2803939 RepID=A0A8J7MSN7_9RHOB|nr:glycosyltransferase family 4 protein [Fuscibacter oryzae]MBL4928210.1 glycosyltransferase family 4 protein [Fuscibacter oryzae]